MLNSIDMINGFYMLLNYYWSFCKNFCYQRFAKSSNFKFAKLVQTLSWDYLNSFKVPLALEGFLLNCFFNKFVLDCWLQLKLISMIAIFTKLYWLRWKIHGCLYMLLKWCQMTYNCNKNDIININTINIGRIVSKINSCTQEKWWKIYYINICFIFYV